MWNIKNIIKDRKEIEIPNNMFVKCNKCETMSSRESVETNLWMCPECGSNFRVSAYDRIKLICDKDTFKEFKFEEKDVNPLKFEKYDKKIKTLRKETGLKEAVLCGEAKVENQKTVICVMDSGFLMGSMGSQVGEYITMAIEYAIKKNLPVVIYTASGGARMQEGIVSLMQMAKISAAIKRHSDKGLLFMPILTDPTTGGVTASFAMLGDIILAEENALICFAGPRVIKETIKEELPEGFQRAEFLLEHGFIDAIVSRKNQKIYIAEILKIHKKEEQND